MNTEHKNDTEEPEESKKPADDKAVDAEEGDQDLDAVELLRKAREQQRQQQQQ